MGAQHAGPPRHRLLRVDHHIGSVLAGVLGATLSAPFVAMSRCVRRRVPAFQAGDPDAGLADVKAPGTDAFDEAFGRDAASGLDTGPSE
jgi:hypothetical protein